MHAVRHLVSGGYIVTNRSNFRSPAVRQAGHAVLDLVKDPVFVRLMGMSDFFGGKNFGTSFTLKLSAFVL